jgi:hypothetical protein
MTTTIDPNHHAVTELPETQCRYCSTIMVFMGHGPSGRTAEWMCPACRSVTTRRLVRGSDLSSESDRWEV